MHLVTHLLSTLKNYFISVVVEDVLYPEVHSQFLVLTGGEGKVTAADTANMTYSLDNFLCQATLPFSEATPNSNELFSADQTGHCMPQVSQRSI